MKYEVELEGSFSELKHIIQDFESDDQVQGIMVITCDDNNFITEQFNKLLRNCTTQIFGGIFPSIIYNANKYNKGSIVMGFTTSVESQIIHNIHQPELSLQNEIEEFSQHINTGKTYIINIDGLSEGIEPFKEELFYTLGLSKNYIGGGAGSLSFQRKPCVITNEGLLQDSAVIALIDVNSGIGVAHGWKNVSEPLKVTESIGNSILSLNWEPAFMVYQQHIESLFEKKINKDNFFSIAKAYPFGISKLENEMVVRDPIGIKDEATVLCVGTVPKNSFVYILTGDENSLLKGVAKAKELAIDDFIKSTNKEPSSCSVTLFIDCISRVLFLEDHFQQELDIVASTNTIGALTLGEIANTGKAYLELYNKTTVIGILED